MIERFPIPININGTIYHSCDIEPPTPGIFADTKKVADTGDSFSSILIFLSGCVKSIISEDNEITDRIQIKSALRKLPFRSAEVIALKSIFKMHSDDGIEGMYKCPRCGNRVISQIVEENGEIISDTRDFVSNLDIIYMDEYVESIEVQLKESSCVINMKTNEVMIDSNTQRLVSMSSIEMRYPTIGDCIEAQTKQGQSDSMRLQYRIYVESITKIDGFEINKQFKEKYGMILFEKIPDLNDIGIISKKVHEYGIDNKVKKLCPECGKEWMAVVNTSNFFVSAPPII